MVLVGKTGITGNRVRVPDGRATVIGEPFPTGPLGHEDPGRRGKVKSHESGDLPGVAACRYLPLERGECKELLIRVGKQLLKGRAVFT